METKSLLSALARSGALYSELKTSTIELSKIFNTTQQTAWRWLLSLEKNALIEKKSSPTGISVCISAKGRRLLQDEFRELKAMLASVPELHGRVFTGIGQGAYYTKMFESRLKDVIGYKPYPGTLNLKVDKVAAERFLASLEKIHIPGFNLKDRTFGFVECYKVTMSFLPKGQSKKVSPVEFIAWVVVPERTIYDLSTIEIVADANLRERFAIKDDDKIVLRAPGADVSAGVSQVKTERTKAATDPGSVGHIIGVVDTMFSRVDMYEFVQKTLSQEKANAKIERYTVPGIKDIPVAALRLFSEFDCDIVIALGMPGPMPIDKQCSHEASLGIQQVQLMTGKHILEVFVHMDEAKNENQLFAIAKDRSSKHTINALALLNGRATLTPFAGSGKRQGFDDAGAIRQN